jgi:hypothetical protein
MLFVHITNGPATLRNFTLQPNGDSQFDLTGNSGVGLNIQTATNLAQWTNTALSTVLPGRITVPASAAGSGAQRYFRAVDGQKVCVENLRLIGLAKDHWALAAKKMSTDVPLPSDVFNRWNYDLQSVPVCPNGGSYSINPINSAVTCTVAGHTH